MPNFWPQIPMFKAFKGYFQGIFQLGHIVSSFSPCKTFIKIISAYKKIGYNINVLQQAACLVVNPITVGNFAFVFNCMLVGWISDSMTVQA